MTQLDPTDVAYLRIFRGRLLFILKDSAPDETGKVPVSVAESIFCRIYVLGAVSKLFYETFVGSVQDTDK